MAVYNMHHVSIVSITFILLLVVITFFIIHTSLASSTYQTSKQCSILMRHPINMKPVSFIKRCASKTKFFMQYIIILVHHEIKIVMEGRTVGLLYTNNVRV